MPTNRPDAVSTGNLDSLATFLEYLHSHEIIAVDAATRIRKHIATCKQGAMCTEWVTDIVLKEDV